MKKYFLFLALGFASLANAQSGSWYIGGSAGLQSTKPENGDALTNWNLSPEIGTFFSDNIQVGAALNLRGSSIDAEDSGFGITPYTRYFFAPGQAFRPFIGAALPITSLKYTFSGSEVKESGFGLNLNAGFGYALSPRWTVVGQFAALGFSANREKTGSFDPVKYTNISLGANTLGVPFNVGLYYTFKQ